MSFFDGPGAPLGLIVRGPLPDGEVAGVMLGHSAVRDGTIASSQQGASAKLGEHTVNKEEEGAMLPQPAGLFRAASSKTLRRRIRRKILRMRCLRAELPVLEDQIGI